jgi:signal transduction histidine kinase
MSHTPVVESAVRTRRLSLRARVSLWSAVLVFSCAAALALVINVSVLAVLDLLRMPVHSGVPPQVALLATHVVAMSMIGVGLVTLVGWLGAFLLTQRSLEPVRDLSRLASAIESETLNTRLEVQGPRDEVNLLADAFNKMLDRLQDAFTRERQFVADASHELRTPLSIVRTNVDIVLADPQASLADYREMAEAVERALCRLERLSADLLLLASAGHDLRQGSVAVASLIEDLTSELGPIARERGVELRTAIGARPVVAGSESLLRRACGNLIENGLLFNHPGGWVTVSTEACDREAIILIADNGVGIPADDQRHIFERFYRVDASRSRHSGGSGIGLALTSEIVRRHGGSVDVTSEPGYGSTFTIRLPGLSDSAVAARDSPE